MTDYAVRWKRSNGNSYFNNGASNGCTISGTPKTVSGASGDGTTVTITTSSAHSYVVGQVVTISGVTPTGYNGKMVIRTVPSSTTFTCAGTATGSLTASGTATPNTEFYVDALNSSETPQSGVQYDINVAVVSLGSVGTWSTADVNSQVTPYVQTTTAPTGTITTSGTQTTADGDTASRASTSSWTGIVVQTANASWTSMTVTYTLLGVVKTVTVLKANVSDKNTVYFTIPKSVTVTVSILKNNKSTVTCTINAV